VREPVAVGQRGCQTPFFIVIIASKARFVAAGPDRNRADAYKIFINVCIQQEDSE